MSDIVERTVAGLTVRLDRHLCVGFGDCIEQAPDFWEWDDEGVVAFKEPRPSIDRERLILSCDVCPVDALTVIDENGDTIVP